MNLSMLFFLSISSNTELYLSRQIKNRTKSAINKKSLNSDISNKLDKELVGKSSNTGTIENEIEDAIENITTSRKEDFIVSSLKKEEKTLASTITEYASQAKDFFSEVKSGFRSFYESIINYSKSIYKSNKQKKKIDPDCWQIGIDVSRTCNFIFFPKKMKKIMGIMIDKGIMLDYINPSPVLCYF